MKILWSANAPWAATGYGVQGKHLLPRLRAAGHEVACFAWYGLQGGMIQADGLTVYPMGHDRFGADVIGAHAEHFGADLVISLMDIWPLPADYRELVGRPWACWFPVDQAPVPQLVLERARTADYPITFARFGYDECLRAGLRTRYIPIGVNTAVYKPGDKATARARLGVPQDAYLCSMVAANNGRPSRKAFPEQLLAFAAYRRKHPEALLYLHTERTGARDGINFDTLIPACDIPWEAVKFVDQYRYLLGLPEEYLALVYQASDVLLAAAQAEGFGIPIVEAQACGCPVITTACTAMTELTCNGIPTPPAQGYWTWLDAWAAVPSVAAIGEALEELRAWREPERRHRREYGITFAREQYSWDVCVRDYWLPFLAEAEAAVCR